MKCGSQMPEGTKFCINCGTPMATEAPVQPQTPVQPIAPVAPAEPQSAPQAQAPIEPQPQAPVQNAAPVAPSQPVTSAAPEQPAVPAAPAEPQSEPQAQAPAVPEQPVTPVQPVYFQPQYDTTPAPMPVMQPEAPVKKKKKGGLIAVIVVLILALLGGGGFGVYKYLSGREPVEPVVDTPEPEPEPDDPDPEPEDTQAKQTIMLYMIGSNLESESGLATADLVEISKSKLTEDTNLVIQTGGCTSWDNTFCKDGTVQRFIYDDGKFKELDDLGAISMVAPATLTDFVEFSAEEYPADDYILILWNHGGGIPIGYGYDELYPNDTLTDYQIGHALDKTGIHFDSIIFDACNMCSLEVGMALKNSADYLIGAESYVNGTGLSYTNWLNLLATSPVSEGKYREMVVSDYMTFCQSRDMVASMSVISLSHIEPVYEAYIEYLDLLKSDLERKQYADITTARDNCGVYMGTDSVDLVTLANKYENTASTKLINSIVNAVDYTESDFAFGHGITAYYPYDYSYLYNDGRMTFQALEYDDTIVDFFDEYVTLSLAFEYGSNEAKSYAGDWFRNDILNTYSSSGGYSFGAEDIYLEAHTATYQDGEEHYYFETSNIDWLEIEALMYLEGNDGKHYFLGQDQFRNFDDDGDLVADNPTYWTYLTDDRVACYIAYDYYKDETTGEWNQYGKIPVKINGVECYLMVFYDQDNPYGMITGYTIMEEEGQYYYELDDYDEIQLIWYCLDDDKYVDAYDPFYAYELELSYDDIDLSSDVTLIVYQVSDVYGNTYTSDAFYYMYGELLFVDEFESF